MSNYKKTLETKLGKGKKFYIHTSQHQYKFSLKKIHTEKETEKETEENIVEWNPSKTTVVGIGSTVTVLVTWISSLF